MAKQLNTRKLNRAIRRQQTVQRSRALAWVMTCAGGLLGVASLVNITLLVRAGVFGQALVWLLVASLGFALALRMARVGTRFNRLLKDPGYLMSRQVDQEELLTAQSGTFLPWKEWRQ